MPAKAIPANEDLKQRFLAAVEKVRTAPPDGPFQPSNELKLKMYALYRQASDGDVQGKRPGVFDLVARYNARLSSVGELVADFWQAVTTQARMNLHVLLQYGRNTHHILEASFKGVARALRDTVRVEGTGVPSTKGTL